MWTRRDKGTFVVLLVSVVLLVCSTMLTAPRTAEAAHSDSKRAADALQDISSTLKEMKRCACR